MSNRTARRRKAIEANSIRIMIQNIEFERRQLRERIQKLDGTLEVLREMEQRSDWTERVRQQLGSSPETLPIDALTVAEAARRVMLESGKPYMSTRRITDDLIARGYWSNKGPKRLRAALTVALHRKTGIFGKHPRKRATWRLVQAAPENATGTGG